MNTFTYDTYQDKKSMKLRNTDHEQISDERAFKAVLCIGPKSIGIKDELVDHQFFCLDLDYLTQAEILLRKALEAQEVLPDAIICDDDFPKAQLILFLNLLKNSARLRVIPFFLFTESFKDTDPQKYLQVKEIDDIYSKESNIQHIADRIKFLVNFKKQKYKLDDDAKVTYVKAEGKRMDINYALKRFGDILISSIMLLVLSPVLLIAAIAVALESRGPIVYSSKRAGQNFKVFNFYKFRTMYLDADKKVEQLKHLNQYDTDEGDKKGAKFFKISNDPRITKVGAILRNTSIDELPQLFNILKGDMSLVGNRPLPLYEANTITTDDWSKRFLAPAGLTGLWQVSKRGKKDMSIDERLGLDVDYAERWSFLQDMIIILKTPGALHQKDNV